MWLHMRRLEGRLLLALLYSTDSATTGIATHVDTEPKLNVWQRLREQGTCAASGATAAAITVIIKVL
jgi:hypothetical protein